MCLHKNQLNALFLSFPVKAQKKRKAKVSRDCFESRFCVSVIMSQHLILSFFVLAPTQNAEGRIALPLPASSNM